uniref:Uncharacterized protein n=1 Tax=Oncorhynchus tshawytscha TaxID=74940 RepID=A0AAZ3PW59_ONCTS
CRPISVVVPPPPTLKLQNTLCILLLGLCNIFAYVVMLSAAHDILKQQGQSAVLLIADLAD